MASGGAARYYLAATNEIWATPCARPVRLTHLLAFGDGSLRVRARGRDESSRRAVEIPMKRANGRADNDRRRRDRAGAQMQAAGGEPAAEIRLGRTRLERAYNR